MSPHTLNELLAGQAAKLVHENFTNVTEQWWWERRIGGGIAICQTFDPKKAAAELSGNSAKSPSEIEAIVIRELGLEDLAPITLAFEVSGGLSETEAAEVFEARSSTPHGIAANIFRELAAKTEEPS